MKKGFTLVELSIVLVIIGLLISGILVGQSMISTARIQNIIRTLQQLDVAVANFQTKYNSLPGDSKSFGGDGDGKISDATGKNGVTGSALFTGEIANFWVSLQQGGFDYQGKTFTTTIPAGGFDISSTTPNSPKIMLDKAAGIVATYTLIQYSASSVYANVYSLADWSGIDVSTAGFTGNAQTLIPITMEAIDKKIDDGFPYSGTVTVMVNNFITTGTNNTCATGTGGPYDMTRKTVGCSLSFIMLSQVGAQ